MIKKTYRPIARGSATNYIQDKARLRAEECIKTYQNQGNNAIGVDSFKTLYYKKVWSTTVCTCKETKQSTSIEQPLNHDAGYGTDYEFSRPLFSEPAFATSADFEPASTFLKDTDLDIPLDEEDSSTVSTNLFGSDIDCGICYRTGFVPAYSRYGAVRTVFTTHNIETLNSYHIDMYQQPHRMNKLDDNGKVCFMLFVPKYYNSVRALVKYGHDAVDECLYIDGVPIDRTLLDAFRGRNVLIEVDAQSFTHVVFEFDLGINFYVNFSQLSRNLDWSNFSTVGSMTAVIPATVSEVTTEDYLFIPDRNLMFKVTDIPYIRLTTEQNLAWTVTVRCLQPQESAKKLAFLRTL